MAVIALDCESTLLPPPQRVRTRVHIPELVCFSYAQKKTTYASGAPTAKEHIETHLVRHDDRNAEKILRMVFGSGNTVVLHNAAFDIGVLAAAYPRCEPLFRAALSSYAIRDTLQMYALRCVDPDRVLTLAHIAWRLLGERLDKGSVRLSFQPNEELTPEQIRYAKEDAAVTLRVYEALARVGYGDLTSRPDAHSLHKLHAQRRYEGPSLDKLYSAAAAWKAFSLERYGLQIRNDKLQEYSQAARATVARYTQDLFKAGFCHVRREPGAPIQVIPEPKDPPRKQRAWKFSPNLQCMVRYTKKSKQWERCPHTFSLNTNKLRHAYEHAAGALNIRDEVPRTPTGEVSMEYDFWKLHTDALPPPLRKHLLLGKSRKLLSSYFTPLTAATRRQSGGTTTVYSNYGIGLCETARWSSWKINVQNFPKNLRSMFEAPEGHVFVSADYKSLEMWTACQCMLALGIKGPLYELLQNHATDIHGHAAKLILETSSVATSERNTAKTANFSFLGGQGVRKFYQKVKSQLNPKGWSYIRAQRIRDRWFETFWDVEEFLELLRVNPYDLKPWNKTKRQWLDELGYDYDKFPSKFELSRALSDGKIYELGCHTGYILPNRGYSQTANAAFQHPGGVAITLAFNLACGEQLAVANVVHDSMSVLSLSDREQAESVGETLTTVMQRALQAVCPDLKIPLPKYEVTKEWC